MNTASDDRHSQHVQGVCTCDSTEGSQTQRGREGQDDQLGLRHTKESLLYQFVPKKG